MMLGVNMFSSLLCFISIIEQGTLTESISFLMSHDHITTDIVLLSTCGALSQFFIYAIVERFGPSVLALIMTIRQFASILLSSAYFSHSMGGVGCLGLLLAFVAILLNIYYNYRKRTGNSARR